LIDFGVAEITFQKTGGQPSEYLSSIQDYTLWYAKNIDALKFRRLHNQKQLGVGHGSGARYDQEDEAGRSFQLTSLTSNRPPGSFPVTYHGREYGPSGGYWKTGEAGFEKLLKADRIRLAVAHFVMFASSMILQLTRLLIYGPM
jgi:adenine-specific DNA-methyltransferase